MRGRRALFHSRIPESQTPPDRNPPGPAQVSSKFMAWALGCGPTGFDPSKSRGSRSKEGNQPGRIGERWRRPKAKHPLAFLSGRTLAALPTGQAIGELLRKASSSSRHKAERKKEHHVAKNIGRQQTATNVLAVKESKATTRRRIFPSRQAYEHHRKHNQRDSCGEK